MRHLALVLLSVVVSVVSFAPVAQATTSTAVVPVNGCVDVHGRAIFLPENATFEQILANLATAQDRIEAAILQKTNCSDAVELANACAYGSTVDTMITDTAERVCRRDMRLTRSDRTLLSQLNARCDRRWRHEEGSMAVGGVAFCHLEALHYISYVASAHQPLQAD